MADRIHLAQLDLTMHELATQALQPFPVTETYVPTVTDPKQLMDLLPVEISFPIITRLAAAQTGVPDQHERVLDALQERAEMEGSNFGNRLQDGYMNARLLLRARIEGRDEDPVVVKQYDDAVRDLNAAVIRMGDRELRTQMNNALTDLKAARLASVSDDNMTLEKAREDMARGKQ